MLTCPRTGKPMEQFTIDAVTVDVSTGCGGVWFDRFEAQKFEYGNEEAGKKLIEIMDKYRSPVPDLEERLHCPKDCGVVMMRHFYSAKRAVVIDECAACGGVWLDPGELATMRSLYASPEQCQAATKQLVEELAASSGLEEQLAHDKAKAAAAHRIARLFKWICPTAYIPGKQSWGAF